MNSIIKQPLAVVTDTIDAIPFDASSIDLPEVGDIVDAAGDLVSTIAVTSGKGAFRIVRFVRRNPRSSATFFAALIALAGVAVLVKRRSVQPDADERPMSVAAA